MTKRSRLSRVERGQGERPFVDAMPQILLSLCLCEGFGIRRFHVAETSFYKRSNFVTHLPVECLYSPSHFWLKRSEGPRWRVGFTKFATRMLGEIVDLQWEKQPGSAILSGEIIGA